MKKIAFIVTALFVSTLFLRGQEPEQVYSVAKVYKPLEWYVKQAELWWKELQKDKKNEKAWYNYFMANRMASFGFENKGDNNKLFSDESKYLMNTDSIVSQAQKYIPDTFTSNYIIWRNHGSTPKDFSHLERAYALNPNFYSINEEMVVYYETQSNLDKRKEYNAKWFKLNELSSNFLSYSYNVLMTINQNGAIIINGDSPTFSIWMLQDALGIRQDVTVLNVALLDIPEYREKLFKKLNIVPLKNDFSDGATSANTDEIFKHIIKYKPKDLSLYIEVSSWKQFKDYNQNFYLVGLALEYSKDNLDNLALLKNNFENKYALDYIKNTFVYDISDELVSISNLNYLPCIYKLYEHYKLSGDLTHAQKMKELGLLIAAKGGQNWLNYASLILK